MNLRTDVLVCEGYREKYHVCALNNRNFLVHNPRDHISDIKVLQI